MRGYRFLAATSLSFVVLGTPALAQTAAPKTDAETVAAEEPEAAGGLADIVVTAQRRKESLQSVPIAISVFTAEQIRAQGINNALQLVQTVPGLVANHNTGLGSANAYYLRGLGNGESIATFDPPVGTYIDDIYISRQNANNFNLLEVERVEVLRGPQGTLFGRNTTGGAVNVIMAAPAKEFGGFAEAGYGSYRTKLARASVNIPLSDAIQTKVSGYWQNGRGYAKNTTTGQYANDDDGWGVRLGVHADVSSSIRWNGSYSHIVNDAEFLPNYRCDPSNPSNCDGRFLSSGFILGGTASTTPYPEYRVNGEKAKYLGGARSGTNLLASNLEFSLSDTATLNVITGYVAMRQRYAIEFSDGRAAPSITNFFPVVQGRKLGSYAILNDSTTKQFSQEVKLTGSLFDGFIDYVAGGFYMKERSKTDFADLLTIFTSSTNPNPVTVPVLLGDRILRNTTESAAGYAQADFNVTGEIKLTAGIRYTDEEKRISVSDNRPECNDGTIEATCVSNTTFVAATGAPIPRRMSVGLWTPRFAVNYKPSDSLLVYASATHGFKSGGWNARGRPAANILPFDPEKIWSYEAGWKSSLFDRRVRLNVTAFYLNNKNLQMPAGFISPNGALTSYTRNFANYVNRGVEAELLVAPVSGLNLFANASYSRDKYVLPDNAPLVDQYGISSVADQLRQCRAFLATGAVPTGGGVCGSGIVTMSGQIAKPQRTPTFTISFGGSYEAPLGSSGLKLVPSVTAYYRTALEVETANVSYYNGVMTGTNGTFPVNYYGNGALLAGSHSPSVLMGDAILTLRGPEERWQVSLQCNNCTDKTRTTATLLNQNFFNPPRSWS